MPVLRNTVVKFKQQQFPSAEKTAEGFNLFLAGINMMKFCYSTNKSQKDSLLSFFEKINSIYIKSEGIQLYIYLPQCTSKASREDFYSLMQEFKIDVLPSSAELSPALNIFSQAIIIHKDKQPFPHIQSTDIVIVPFYEIPDYQFLKKIEYNSGCGIICLSKILFYRQSRDTFIRSIGEYGYIYSQLTKHDRTYTQEGRAFLEVLSRKPQSLETLAIKACDYFEGVTPTDILSDMQEFLDSLVADRYLVSGNTTEECAEKDTYFNYAENPKTLFTYNAQQDPNDEKKYADTQEVLSTYYRNHPQIHVCQIEVTNKCNERCIHCYIPHELKNVTLSYDVIENVLQQLYDLGVMQLTLSGGEFFSHPDVDKILRKARELDFSITILSNITLISPKTIDLLKEINPGLIQTSLYSIYPDEHDHITQLKGSCEKTKASIDALIAASIPVQINCPVMKTNYHSYKDVLKFAYERNCKAHTDFVMMARYDFTTDNLIERLSLEQTKELIQDVIKFDKDYLKYTETPISNISWEEWSKRPFCGVGMSSFNIASDGIVYPCSGWQGMACGNVREQPIKDIWEKSPQLIKLRNLTKSAIPQCYDCEDRQFCAPCLVRNFNESGGDYLKVASHFCKATHLNRILVESARKEK